MGFGVTSETVTETLRGNARGKRIACGALGKPCRRRVEGQEGRVCCCVMMMCSAVLYCAVLCCDGAVQYSDVAERETGVQGEWSSGVPVAERAAPNNGRLLWDGQGRINQGTRRAR